MSSGADRQQLRRDPRPDELTGLLAPVVSAADLDLEAVEVTPAGRRRLLRVVVDRDGGIDLDGIAEASHAISAALDGSDVMGGTPYVLEVSSPGVDRPMTAPRHWRRARGRLVRAVLSGGEVVTGRVLAADDEGATVDVDGRERRLAYAAVASARVQVEFGRAEGPDADGPDPDGPDPDGPDPDGAEPDGTEPDGTDGADPEEGI